MNLNYERHPLSAVFGDMSSEDFGKLKADIIEQGVLEKKIVLKDGQVLDGWHRYSAVKLIIEDSVSPDADLGLSFVEFDGADPVKFVLSRNLHRRQLSVGQKAAVTVAANKWKPHGGIEYKSIEGRARPSIAKSEADMAKEAQVGRTSIKQVKQLEREAKDLLDRVKNNDMSLNAAMTELRRRKDVERRIKLLFEKDEELAERVIDGELELEEAEEKLAERDVINARKDLLGQQSPDLLDKVDSGEMTLDAAEGALEAQKIEAARRRDAAAEEARQAAAEKAAEDARKAAEFEAMVRRELLPVAPDLYNQVIVGKLSLDEAKRILEERLRPSPEPEKPKRSETQRQKPREEPKQDSSSDTTHTEEDPFWERFNQRYTEFRKDMGFESGESSSYQSSSNGGASVGTDLSSVLTSRVRDFTDKIDTHMSTDDAKKVRNLFLRICHPDKVRNDFENMNMSESAKSYWNTAFEMFHLILGDVSKGMR